MTSQSSRDVPQDQNRQGQNGSQQERCQSSSHFMFAYHCPNKVASLEPSDSSTLMVEAKQSRMRSKEISLSSDSVSVVATVGSSEHWTPYPRGSKLAFRFLQEVRNEREKTRQIVGDLEHSRLSRMQQLGARAEENAHMKNRLEADLENCKADLEECRSKLAEFDFPNGFDRQKENTELRLPANDTDQQPQTNTPRQAAAPHTHKIGIAAINTTAPIEFPMRHPKTPEMGKDTKPNKENQEVRNENERTRQIVGDLGHSRWSRMKKLGARAEENVHMTNRLEADLKNRKSEVEECCSKLAEFEFQNGVDRQKEYIELRLPTNDITQKNTPRQAATPHTHKTIIAAVNTTAMQLPEPLEIEKKNKSNQEAPEVELRLPANDTTQELQANTRCHSASSHSHKTSIGVTNATAPLESRLKLSKPLEKEKSSKSNHETPTGVDQRDEDSGLRLPANHTNKQPQTTRVNSTAQQETADPKSFETENIAEIPLTKDSVNKGFSVRQLVQFYKHVMNQYRRQPVHFFKHSWTKQDIFTLTTQEVARNIIAPDTSQARNCYMHSDFMNARGGPKTARKLVCHSWQCSFMDLVTNVLLNATGYGMTWMYEKGIVRKPRTGTPTIYELDADAALTELSVDVLEATYWIDIFAISQHTLVGGDCSQCRDEDRETHKRELGEVLIGAEVKQAITDHGGAQPNPIEQMSEVMVSLDPMLRCLERFWVVIEIIHAIQVGVDVSFHVPGGQLAQDIIGKLKERQEMFPSVEHLKVAKKDEAEKKKAIKRITGQLGGLQSFHQLAKCIAGLQVGVFHCLSDVTGIAAKTLHKLQHLQMDCSWARHITSLEKELGMGRGGWAKLKNLQRLRINLHGCKALTSIAECGMGLGQCQALMAAEFNFSGCSALASIDEFGKALGRCKALTTVSVSFDGCDKLTSIVALGTGLGQCQALTTAEFDFSECSGIEALDGLGRGLGRCQSLTTAEFNFSGCSGLKAIDQFGKAFGQCQALTTATFNFDVCYELTGIDGLGQGLGQCQSLTTATFSFRDCDKIACIDEFAKGLGQCRALTTANFNFSECSALKSIDGLGKGLGQCQALTAASFDIEGCASLTSIDDFGKSLGQCQALTTAHFNFKWCLAITSIDGLGRCQALTTADFQFNDCLALTSIAEFGKSLGQWQSLMTAEFNFSGCSALTSINELKSLRKCQALTSASFDFLRCDKLKKSLQGRITHRNELADACRQCQALNWAAAFDVLGYDTEESSCSEQP